MPTNEGFQNFKFRIKLIKKDRPGLSRNLFKLKVGLYEELKRAKVKIPVEKDFEKALETYYNNIDKNEYRKKFNLRGKISK